MPWGRSFMSKRGRQRNCFLSAICAVWLNKINSGAAPRTGNTIFHLKEVELLQNNIQPPATTNMAPISPESRTSLWLRLVNNLSAEDLRGITTSYSSTSARSQASCDEVLAPLAVLLQCRLDVLSLTETLKRAESWAVLNSSQTQLSRLRTRFRNSVRDLNGAALVQAGRMSAGDLPFGKVQWERTGKS